MSKEVDEKVVAIRFDNSRFEKNVRDSMNTLDRLNEKMDFSKAARNADVLEDAVKRCDISPLGDAADKVKMRFSALEVVAVTALVNITNKAVNAGERMIKSLSIDQITSGWTKYGQKTASVQTIMNATGKTIDEVNGYLNKLMWFSDETSFGFTDMTAALSTMTSAGGDIEKLIPMIEGIANATAYAGKGAAEFSRVIYNLNQSYGQGYLSLLDWKSVSGASVDSKALKETLIQSAAAMGKLKKNSDGTYKTLKGNLVTAATFANTLNEKWADTAVMEDAFTKFASMTEKAYEMVQSGEAETATEAYRMLSGQFDEVAEKAAKAGQEAKTFSEAIDATKDAVSSKWMKTFEIIFGNYEQAKALWTNVSESLYEIFAAGGDERNDMLEDALNGPWERLSSRVEAAGGDVEIFKKQLIEAGKAAGTVNDELINSAGGFEESLSTGWLTKDIIVNVLENLSDEQKNVAATTADMTKKLEEFQKVVDKVWHGDYKNGKQRVEALTAAGYNYKEVQDLVNKTVDKHRLTLADLTEEQLSGIGCTKEQIAAFSELSKQAKESGSDLESLISDMSKASGRDLLHGSITRILSSVAAIRDALSEAKRDIFGSKSGFIYGLLSGLDSITRKFEVTEDKAEKIRRTFSGLFSVIKLGTDTIKSLFAPVLDLISEKFESSSFSILDITAKVGDMLSSFSEMTRNRGSFVKIGDMIADAFGKGSAKIQEFKSRFSGLGPAIAPISNTISKLASMLRECFASTEISKAATSLSGLTSVSNQFAGVFDSDAIGQAKTSISGFFDNIKERSSEFGEELETLKQQVIDFGVNLEQRLGSLYNRIKTIYDSFIDRAIKLREKFNDNIGLSVILAVGMTSAVILAINKFADALLVLTKVKFGTISEFLNGMTQTLGTLRTTMVTYQNFLKRKTFLEIAKGIGILVASLAVLTFLPKDQLGESILVLAGLAIGIAALSTYLNYIGGNVKVTSNILALTGSILVLSIALNSLGESMKLMDEINPSRLIGATGALMSVMLPLALFVKYIRSPSISPLLNTETAGMFKQVFIVAGSTLAMVGALYSIGKTLEKIATLKLDVETIKGNLSKYIIVFGAFIAVCLSAAFLAKYGKAFSGIGTAILGMVSGLMLFGVALKILKKSVSDIASTSNTTDTEFKRIMDIISMFSLIIVGMIGVSHFAGKYSGRAGLMLLGVAASMTVLTGVIYVLGKIKPNELAPAVDSVAAIGMVFAAIVWASRGVGEAKLAITAIGVVLASLIAALIALSFLEDQRAVLMSAMSLSLVLAAVAVAFRQASHIGKDANAGAITVLSLAIAALGGIVYVLSNQPWENTIGAAGAMGIVMLSLAAAFRIMNVDVIPVAVQMAKTLGVMTLVVAALGTIVYALAKQPWENTVGSSGALSLVMIAFAAAFRIITTSIAPTVNSLLAPLGVMTLVVAALGTILGIMDAMGVQNGIENATALSILIGALTVGLLGMAAVGALSAPVLTGLGVLAVTIAAAGVIFLALGELMDLFPDLQTKVENGTKIIGTVVGAFGEMIGTVIDEALMASTANLGTISERIETFMNVFKNAPPELQENATAVMNAIQSLLSTTILDGTSEKLSNAMDSLGESYGKFVEKIRAIGDTSAVYSAIYPIERLCEALGNLSDVGGGGAFSGKFDIHDIGTVIADLGTGLANFAANSENVSAERVTSLVDAIKEMTTIGDYDYTGFISFSSALESVATSGLDAFTTTLANGKDSIASTINNTLTQAREACRTKTEYENWGSLGIYFMNGLNNGLKEQEAVVCNTTYKIGQKMLKKFRESTGISSPSKAMQLNGAYIDDGLILGLKSRSSTIYDTVESIGDGVLGAFRDTLGIHSPSSLTELIGKFFDQGFTNGVDGGSGDVFSSIKSMATNALSSLKETIASGKLPDKASSFLGDIANVISNDTKMSNASNLLAGNVMNSYATGLMANTSAEDAATKKARAIVDAFKTELDKADLNKTTNDLEYKLYVALNGDSDQAKLENLQKNAKEQASKVALAQSEYELTLSTFGETAKETQEAYNKLLQVQIDLADINNNINEIQSSQIQSNQNAMLNYAKWMAESKDMLLQQGFSLEEIEAAARARTGYGVTTTDISMKNTATEAVSSAMGIVQEAYSKSAEETFGSMVKDGSINKIVDTMSSVITNAGEDWYRAGANMVQRLIDGINSKIEAARSASVQLYNIVSSVINSTERGSSPTIAPVLDLSNVQRGAKDIGKILSGGASFNIDGAVRQANAVSSARKQNQNAGSSSSSVTNVNLVQNNTSPKFLDPVTIYRQTKNLMSAVKAINEKGASNRA